MNILEHYVCQISKFKLLSAEEEKELSRKIKKGSRTAVNELVNSNLRLVVSVAGKLVKNYKVSVMDLIQEGNLGLMAAAEKFSHSFNTKFSTYAYPWILQYMLRFVHSKNSMISIPQRKEVLLRNCSEAQNLFVQKYGRFPSKDELCSILKIKKSELDDIFSFNFSFTSLDAFCGDDSDTTFGELIPDYTFNPEISLMKKEKIRRLHDLLSSLPEKERKVILERYNFRKKIHEPTLREISCAIGVSAETVRQIEIRALKKLKAITCDQKNCEEFLDSYEMTA